MATTRKLLTLLMTLALGCAANRGPIEPPTTELEPGIYDVADARRLTPEQLWPRLADARFVLVGETHDSERDHAMQLQILTALADRDEVALGMEMFQRPFQGALDAYVAGELDEEAMLERTQWEDRWGFATAMYAPMWRLAAEREFPILALNVRRELTKRIAAVGLDGLTDAERADLPEIDRTGERYRAWMRDIFRSHGAPMEPEKFERFYQAQITWDETMADTAVEWSRAHPGATVVIVVGRGHVERDFGIPSRIRRRVGAEHGDGTVVSIVGVAPQEVPRYRWMRRERFADFVWVDEREEPASPH